MSDEDQPIETLFDRHNIAFCSDGELIEAKDNCLLLNKNDSKNLYLAMKKYFESEDEI